MSDLRTAAQQALEAMESYRNMMFVEAGCRFKEGEAAITALRAALAQQDEPKGGGNLPPPLQAEPVAWMSPASESMIGKTDENGSAYHIITTSKKTANNSIPLYTAPPRREWQGLTEEDVAQNLRSRHDAAKLLEERRQEITQPRREWQSLSEEEIDRWTPEIHPVSKEQDMKLRAFLRGFVNGLALLPLWRWFRRKI